MRNNERGRWSNTIRKERQDKRTTDTVFYITVIILNPLFPYLSIIHQLQTQSSFVEWSYSMYTFFINRTTTCSSPTGALTFFWGSLYIPGDNLISIVVYIPVKSRSPIYHTLALVTTDMHIDNLLTLSRRLPLHPTLPARYYHAVTEQFLSM